MKAGFQNLSPQTLRSLKDEELLSLTNYLRERIIHVVAKRGGHLGASLGVVELTVALHKVLIPQRMGSFLMLVIRFMLIN